MLEWNVINQQFGANSLEGCCGKIRVFMIEYSGMAPKSEPGKYKLNCYLPGFKSCLGFFATDEEAKAQAKQSFERWLMMAELKQVAE